LTYWLRLCNSNHLTLFQKQLCAPVASDQHCTIRLDRFKGPALHSISLQYTLFLTLNQRDHTGGIATAKHTDQLDALDFTGLFGRLIGYRNTRVTFQRSAILPEQGTAPYLVTLRRGDGGQLVGSRCAQGIFRGQNGRGPRQEGEPGATVEQLQTQGKTQGNENGFDSPLTAQRVRRHRVPCAHSL
jgi:hypothetical protein